MQTKETRGLVLYNRPFREDDKLVKIFTETSGKHMFFVRHATNSKLSSVIQPLILANFILKINLKNFQWFTQNKLYFIWVCIKKSQFYSKYFLKMYFESLCNLTFNIHILYYLTYRIVYNCIQHYFFPTLILSHIFSKSQWFL